MPRQVVPSTDKICQEDFPKAFFQSALRKSIKISKKAMFKQIVKLSLIICFKALYEQWAAPFVEEHAHTLLTWKKSSKILSFKWSVHLLLIYWW